MAPTVRPSSGNSTTWSAEPIYAVDTTEVLDLLPTFSLERRGCARRWERELDIQYVEWS